MFLIVILGAPHKRAPVGFAGLAIGMALTLIHLISIPVTNTSVNPARSTGPALFVGDWALAQLCVRKHQPLQPRGLAQHETAVSVSSGAVASICEAASRAALSTSSSGMVS